MISKKKQTFRLPAYALMLLVTFAICVLCVCLGSVNVPLSETLSAIFGGNADLMYVSIIRTVRLPRVLCVALSGAALSLCGAVMQGLLRNPMADGSTLGVSSGASLGAAVAIAFGISVPGLPFAGTALISMIFAFASLILIITLSYRFDCTLSTSTIILIGIIFSMFVSAILNLIITFSPGKLKTITFWTMGSLAGSTYADAALLACALLLFGGILTAHAEELNAFAIGEENARHIGVRVRRVKLTVLICVSALIGICVSVGGTIGFVGLVIPHMTRMLVGPNHRRLLPASVFSGACFLMLADLLSRVLLNPLELPIGVVTSIIGAVAFILILYRSRKIR